MKNKLILITVVLLALTLLSIIFLLPINVAKAESKNSDGIKIKGSIEQTFKSIKDGNSALGNETNVEFLGKKELDNGMTVSGAIRLEDNAIDKASTKLSKGPFAIEFGADTGDNIHWNVNPVVAEEGFLVGPSGMKGNDGFTSFQTHDVQHVGLSYDTGVGKVTFNYAPSNNPISAGDGSTADNGGSAKEIVFQGNLGIPELTFIAGREIVNSDTSSDGKEKETVIGAAYNMGRTKFGATYRTFDNGSISSTSVDNSLAYSIAYSLTDNLSVGLERVDTELETTGTTKESITTGTVGYSYGPIGIAVSLASVDNLGGTSGATGESFQIRTMYKF